MNENPVDSVEGVMPSLSDEAGEVLGIIALNSEYFGTFSDGRRNVFFSAQKALFFQEAGFPDEAVEYFDEAIMFAKASGFPEIAGAIDEISLTSIL